MLKGVSGYRPCVNTLQAWCWRVWVAIGPVWTCYRLDVERGAQEVGTSRTLWGLCVGHLRHDNLVPEVVAHQWRMTTTALVHQSKRHLRHTQQSALYFSHKDMLIEWVNNCWLGWQNRTDLWKCTHLYNEMQRTIKHFQQKVFVRYKQIDNNKR